METYTTDQERVDAIKRWWRDNGNAVIGGALLGLAVVFGYRWWVDRGEAYKVQASQHYAALQDTLRAGKLGDAEGQINVLRAQFSDTPYAALASFIEARIKTERNDLDGARTALGWVIEHATLPETVTLARLRLARLLLAQGKMDEALKTLPETTSDAQAVARTDLLGDIHGAKGEKDQARAAYDAALAAITPEQATLRQLIEMKRDALGVAANAALGVTKP